MNKIKKNISGLTLVEIIVSLAIMGIIAVTLLPLFTISAKSNSKSESSLNSTYIGKNIMELIYSLSKKYPYEELEVILIEQGFTKDISSKSFNREESDKKYSVIEFNEEGNLIRVTVKIYIDETKNQIESQYETLYSWKGRGILSEK